MTDPQRDMPFTPQMDFQSRDEGLPCGLCGQTAPIAGLTAVLRALGSPGFYEELLDWLETFIPNDFWFIADYSHDGKPIIHQDTWQKNDAKSFYFSKVCQYDPVFHALGDKSLMPGTSISMIKGQYQIDDRYHDYMKNVANIADELMILLPRPGGTYTAICLDREEYHFTVSEVHSARQISALLAEIMELHWQRLPIIGETASQAALSGLRQPGFERKVEQFSRLYNLTSRESEITTLSLRGYSTMAMAKLLGIRQGTVKNHKMRLYQKLDITNERELVPLFLDE